MATYFGYVEREADSYVNWADVGRNMSATIDNIQRVRDEKKALIEKAYREDLDYIQSRPSGEHETLNAWSLNFGNTSAENLKLKYSQLKQGKISVNDFVTFRQNLSDSVEKIYTVNGQLQEAFKKVNDRTKAGENQMLERETKVLLEKYGQLENTLPYINGLTGSVAIGLTEITKDAEGKEVRKLRQGDDAYLTPAQLQSAAMQEFNAYNEQADLDAWVESLGDVQESLRGIGGESLAGLITSVTDVTSERILSIANELPEGSKLSEAQMTALQNFVTEFKAGETEYIDAILANPYNASALLTDRMKINPDTKKPYNIVFNKADQKTTNDLYVEKTPEGKFTPKFDTEIGEKQADQLRGFLKGQLRIKYDRKVEMDPYNEPTPPRPIVQGGNYDAGEAASRASYLSMFEMYNKLFTGTFDEKQTILNNLKQAGKVNGPETYYDDKTGKLIITPQDVNKDPIIYDFNNPPNVDTRQLVFSILNLIDPALNSKYSAYAQSVPLKKIDKTLPMDERIKIAQKNVDDVKEGTKNKNPIMKKIYEDMLPEQEKILNNLLDEQKSMRQSGGTTGKFNQ